MSDVPQSAFPGTISPRNIDTVVYRVIQNLPKDNIASVGGTFSAWPQGETFACVSGVGLGPVKNSDLAEWEELGLIVREKPLTAAQERDRMRAERVAAVPVAETADHAPAAPESGGSRPWTLPGAVAVAEAKE